MSNVYRGIVKQARSLLIGDFFTKSQKHDADATAEEACRVLEELVEKPLNTNLAANECVPPVRRLLTTGDAAIACNASGRPDPQPLDTSKSAEAESTQMPCCACQVAIPRDGKQSLSEVATNLMQEGLYLQDSSQMGVDSYEKLASYEISDADKGFEDAAISCEVCDTCSNSVKESLGTPPSHAIRYHLAGPHGVPHSQLQVSSGHVQRRLTFVREPMSEQMCHSKFVFPNRKNLSRSQKFYKVVPKVEDGALSMSGLTANDFHAQMQARGIAFDEDACKKRCAWISDFSFSSGFFCLIMDLQV
ncbi:hypothetical protein L7F22_005992 [Adiantum nelumboides]|nr:hypothetical protein [Adiantum nelumboides]